MKIKSSRTSAFIFGAISLLLIALLTSACAQATPDPGDPAPPEPGQVEEEGPADSPIPPSDTAVPDTAVPTVPPTLTATPLPTLTATPAPLANITGNTNCRTGPGSVYDLLHTYLAGNQVELLGKSPDGFYWYTRASSEYAPDCWLWGKYTDAVGDTKSVPVLTPPPTPTPSPAFEISHYWADCFMSKCYFFFKIENTGSAAWESALLFAAEPMVPQDAGNFSNSFLVDGQHTTPTKARILPGDTGYFHAARLTNPGAYGKTPGVIDFYFTACTEDNLGGYCVTKMWTDDDLW